MIITKDLGLFRHTEEYNYTPTPVELYFWYQGTNAGLTRDNPYHKRNSTGTKRRFTEATQERRDISDE